MKNLGAFYLLLVCIGLEGCKKNESVKDVETTPVHAEKLAPGCYKALYEKDTVQLKINASENGKITGDMVMKIFNMPEKVGKISGTFHGDTLFADYSFIERQNEKKTFKNPIALLKRGDELILGNGKIEVYLGVSYFAEGIPIDFDRVKYKFAKVDCVTE